ncbi:MAG: hypothetical protein GVY14_09240 [Spirochaetes bacterium]|nr:hypothetical protein [Spirochaetota bacterium]
MLQKYHLGRRVRPNRGGRCFRRRGGCHRAVLLICALLSSVAVCAPAQEPLHDDWVRFAVAGRSGMLGWGASSVLESGQPLVASRYGPEKALDGNAATAWVEGAAGEGRGERYYLSLKSAPEALGFINGYAQNRSLFEKNHRVRRLTLQVFASVQVSGFATERAELFDARAITDTRTLRLSDVMEAQRVRLPFSRRSVIAAMEDFRTSEAISTWRFPQAREMGLDGSEGLPLYFRYILRLEIDDVYRGTAWEDTCIAELWPDYGTANTVAISDDGRALTIETAEGDRVSTYADAESVLSLVETGGNGEWAIVLREPAYQGEGRAETAYAVVHTPTGRDVGAMLFGDSALLGPEILPVGFSNRAGNTYVEYENLRTGETGRVLCSLYGE